MKKKQPSGGSAKHPHAADKNGKHAGGGKHHTAAKPAPKKKKKANATHTGPKHDHKQHAKHQPQHGKHQPKAKAVKWSPGWGVACCAAEALAASLRLTGTQVSDEDVLSLYWHTTDDPDAGATIWDTITAAATYGLAGVRPVDARPARLLGDGTILAIDLTEPHAITLDGAGIWTWGEWRPATVARLAGAAEAWEVAWA